MGFTSQDDLLNQISVNAKMDTIVYQKTTVGAGTAGYWQHLFTSAGSVPAATFGGTELTYTATDDTWSEGTIPIADQTAPATKHILNMGVSAVAAAGAPWFALPIDLVGYVKMNTTNVTVVGEKVFTMTAIGSGAGKGDRYPAGVGLRAFVAAYGTMGANAPTMQLKYTNTAGTAGQVTTAGAVSLASAPNGTILHSGNAANKYGPFLPLAAGDTGISDLESLTWGGTAHASGNVIVGLCKPLCMPIPVPATGLYSMVDFVNTLPSLPRLKNGCNLSFLLFGTGATTSGGTFYANFDYGWGG